MITKFAANAGGKDLVNIEEGVGLEDLRENPGVLEVDDTNYYVDRL